jgi:glycosyltransferase involved in cell wall biosynthesis
MQNIKLEITQLDPSIQSIILDGLNKFQEGNYQKAYSQFQAALNADVKIENLQLMAGSCLFKLGQSRLARLYTFREALDYPENIHAGSILLDQYEKTNGKVTTAHVTASRRPDQFPSISLVLIVKNEEAELPKCLDSFKDIVQEIIVVDTGSTDRTVEIAKAYGARVETYPWSNDFAAARNESLKYATCDWILRTDADEYIEEPEKAKLLHTINSGKADIYICPTISTINGAEDIVENVRLIRNHLGVKYDYVIHETVGPSAVKLGLTQAISNVQFRHSGYDLDESGWKEKIARNIRICDQAIAANPDDSYIHLIKGCSVVNSDRAVAIREFEEGIRCLTEDAMGVKYLGIGYCFLADQYFKEKKDAALFNILMDIQIDFMAIQSMMQFLADFYLYQLCDWKTAKKLYGWASHREVSPLFSELLTPDLYNIRTIQQRLVEVSVLDHDQPKAGEYLQAIYPGKSLNKKKSSANKPTDQPDDDSLIRRMENHPDLTAESLRRLAKAYKNKEEWQKAYNSLIQAAALGGITAQDYFDLAIDQVQLDRILFAQTLVNEGKKLDPDSPLGANTEAFIAMKEKNYEKALEKAVEAFIRMPNNSGFQGNVEQIAAQIQLTPVQALKKVGLNWIHHGQTKNGIFTLMMYSRFQPEDMEVKSTISRYMNI